MNLLFVNRPNLEFLALLFLPRPGQREMLRQDEKGKKCPHLPVYLCIGPIPFGEKHLECQGEGVV